MHSIVQERNRHYGNAIALGVNNNIKNIPKINSKVDQILVRKLTLPTSKETKESNFFSLKKEIEQLEEDR